MPETAKTLTLGPRTLPAQGDVVTAIGHPNGLNFSATDGIVSAVRKNSDGGEVKPEDDRSWVQTNAVISGGSSGGPLLSDTGRVVGINTMVVPGRGVAFAVHVSHLSTLLEQSVRSSIQPLPGDPGSELFDPLAQFEPRVREMYLEYQNASREYQRMLEQAFAFQRKQIERDHNPGPKYAQRFLQIADEQRRSTLAFQALYMACLVDSTAEPATSLKRALDLMLEDHARERWLDRALVALSQVSHDAVPVFLRKVLEQSPHKNVQGVACFCLASSLQRRPSTTMTPCWCF